MKKLFVFSLALLCSAFLLAKVNHGSQKAARAVIDRFLGSKELKIDLKLVAGKEGECDRFTRRVTKDGRLQIEGNSAVALCRGFYDYVRSEGLGVNAWSGNRLELPSTLAQQEAITKQTPFQHHQYYNVVTYGYSLPYWDWKRWEQEIDWMAMHGIDMPLALVANEAISARVWKKLGLTEEEIQNYFVGPAHLPWMRMGNISGVDSPMPTSWHEDQIELQHKILKRLRELGMKPICPGFAGFLPKEIKRIYPEAHLVQSDWDAFHNWMLMADDPLFQKIGKMFVEEWEKEFGECDYYIADSFNEMSVPFPPKNSKERYDKLSEYGRAVYEGICQANPKATWVMQGWMLGFTRSIWDYESYSALMQKIPSDKVLILDMAEDYNYKWWRNKPNWEFFHGFNQKQWVYSTIPNMGGKSGLTGFLEFYANGGRLDALNSPERGNLVGYGTAPEGIENNEVIYELICDAGWTNEQINLKEWLANYSRCRYGKQNSYVDDYWREITQSVYNNFTDHPRYVWQLRPGRAPKGTYQIDSLFFSAIEKFALAAGELKDNEQYVTDLTELSAQYAGGKMEILCRNVIGAATWGEVESVDSVAQYFTQIATKMDQVLSAHPIFNLQRWIDMARSHANSEQEAAYYEKNAKRIVTVWGPPVNDYSARMWSGLIRDFYLPRYQLFFESLKTGNPVDYNKWECNWVENSKGLSPVQKPVDQIKACLELIELCRKVSYKETALVQENDLGAWQPSMLSNDWKQVEWTVPVSALSGLKGVSFRWTKGSEKLEILNVELEVDGQIVANEEHFGETGIRNKQNDYRLLLPAQLGGNNGVTLRATVRTTGNCQSYGRVVMIH